MIAKTIGVLTLLSMSFGGFFFIDNRYAPMGLVENVERSTLEARLEQTEDSLARASDPRQIGRLEERLRNIKRELCSKYPESFYCA